MRVQCQSKWLRERDAQPRKCLKEIGRFGPVSGVNTDAGNTGQPQTYRLAVDRLLLAPARLSG